MLVVLALAALMVATRVHHFGSALHLPDASMAVFFLAGLHWRQGVRGIRAYGPLLLLVALAVGVDWASVTFAGVSDFCITPAYTFLLPAYGVLWGAGRWVARRSAADSAGLIRRSAAALAAAVVSFLISNGAFYWLGGRYPDPNVVQYVERLWQWGPVFVRTTMVYVLVALVLHALAVAFTRSGLARRPAGA